MHVSKKSKDTDKIEQIKKNLYLMASNYIPDENTKKRKNKYNSFVTYEAQYKAIKSEINGCTKDEKAILEILITQDLDESKRNYELKTAAPFFISIFSLLIVTINTMFSNSNIKIPLDAGKLLALIIGDACIIYLLLYGYIEIRYSRRIKKYSYIDSIIKKLNNTQNTKQ
jgi:hypothetical protein